MFTNASSVIKYLSKRNIFILTLIVAMLAAGFYSIQYIRHRDLIERMKADIVLKNQSLAQLENYNFTEATEGFRSLIQSLPNEKLGLQNLVVTQLLQLTELDRIREADKFASIAAELQNNVSQLIERDQSDAATRILSARLHEALEDPNTAINSYQQAGKLDLKDPVPLYQAFQLMQQKAGDFLATDREAVIREAYKRSPNNLGLVLAYLKFLAAEHHDNFANVLNSSRELFLPFSARVGEVLPNLLNKAADAANKKDWQTVKTQLAFTGNVLLGEIAYTHDLNRLNPHLLEYVLADFSPEFYKQYPTLRESVFAPVNVQFVITTLNLSLPDTEQTAVELCDFDLDGLPDLITATTTRLSVVSLSNPDTVLCSLALQIPVQGIVAADLDRDYQMTRDQAMNGTLTSFLDSDLDLILWGTKGLRLVENGKDLKTNQRTLIERPISEDMRQLRNVQGVAIADLDHDGDLDLAISSEQGVSLWSNRGDWTFENFTAYSHLPKPANKVSRILPIDIDRNVLNDFLLASESGLTLMENNLHGRYITRELSSVAGSIRDVAVIDINRDASWDVLTAGKSGVKITQGLTLQNGGWKPQKTTLLTKHSCEGVLAWDYNNDGLDDAVIWGESGVQILMGTKNHHLLVQEELTAAFPTCNRVIVTDADGDGDQDLLLIHGGKVSLAKNEGGNQNHWIEVRLRAEENAQSPRERCNMHGVGNLLELKSDGVYQSRIVRGPKTHFGLGQQQATDVLRVLWTNGIPHNVLNPQQDKVIFEQQKLKGSCPYLYTWNGERFVFATDCLWASPIGLQFAQGVLAPAREWEYLKLSRNHLKAKDGEYILQMTEELWEAAYYDSVKLIAIDHPADVEVFTNEKVGPANLAKFQVHTVTQPRFPKSIIDQQGRDVSKQVQFADGNYTRTWEKSYTQGLTETHWLEIDLGELENPQSIKLFLTGWVLPTDTSLNIAISQNPNKPRPQPPALSVLDEQGEWKEVSPDTGFPGGKTKTIVVDLTDQFLTTDYRLRIATNMEICWDQVFFTLNKQSEDYTLTELSLLSADLHYRGFSSRVANPRNAPEGYDYHRVSTESLWPPMGGDFTRYGVVTELIQHADDLQVVMGAGDEMTVRFGVPSQPIPNGWVRDFILYNIGWDKDADLNTVQGQQVDPLPFRDMKSYPYAPFQSFPDTPKHRNFLRDYQTRRQPRPRFRTEIRDWPHRETK